VKKSREDKPAEEGVGMNVKSIVVVALMMVLMLFAVHCTWVTSNAYSSPSIVLASYGHDGYVCAWIRATSLHVSFSGEHSFFSNLGLLSFP